MIKKSRQKFKYLENEKSFKDERKSVFHYFYRAFIKANKTNFFLKVRIQLEDGVKIPVMKTFKRRLQSKCLAYLNWNHQRYNLLKLKRSHHRIKTWQTYISFLSPQSNSNFKFSLFFLSLQSNNKNVCRTLSNIFDGTFLWK